MFLYFTETLLKHFCHSVAFGAFFTDDKNGNLAQWTAH